MPLSSKQMECLALAWQCFDTEPKIDYEKFKTVAGLASAASARELMRVTKKKLKGEYGSLSGGVQAANAGSSTPKTPSTTTATTPKRAAPSSGTGTGKGRKSSNKKNASHTLGGGGGSGSDDEGEVEATPVRKKARADSASPAGEGGC